MRDRGPRSAAALLVVGLVVATLHAGIAPAASAAAPGCETPGYEGKSGRAVLVTDLRYERGGDVGAPACAAGLAGALCLDVWHTTLPLTRLRPSGIAQLCAVMVLAARLQYAPDGSGSVPEGA